MRVFEVSFSVMEEAETPEEAVDQVLLHYNIRDYLDVTDVTDLVGLHLSELDLSQFEEGQ